jgi:hypothetical protein
MLGLLLGAGALAVAVVLATTRGEDRTFAFAEVPEASLYFPGSTVLSEAQRPAAGGSHARRWVALGSMASLAGIQEFYETRMASRRDWVADGSSSSLLSTDEAQVCAWHNASVTLRLGFEDMTNRSRLPIEQRQWTTVYSLTIIDKAKGTGVDAACVLGRN